jgi:hypothetical protein
VATKDETTFLTKVVSHPGYQWSTVETTHFNVRAKKGSYAASQLKRYAEDAESARAYVLQKIGEGNTRELQPANLFFLDSPAELSAFVGQPAGGWTAAESNTVLMAVSDSTGPPIRHELAHLYSYRLWGPTRFAWISEGVAVFAVGGCRGAPLAAWMKAVQDRGLAIPLLELETNFDFTKAAPHLEAGSYVEYVAEHHGLSGVRRLWNRGIAGNVDLQDESATKSEQNWRQATAVNSDTTPRNPAGRVRCEL